MPRTKDGGWLLDESDCTIPEFLKTEKDREDEKKIYKKEAMEIKKQLEEMFRKSSKTVSEMGSME